jgi:hypothetical protein
MALLRRLWQLYSEFITFEWLSRLYVRNPRLANLLAAIIMGCLFGALYYTRNVYGRWKNSAEVWWDFVQFLCIAIVTVLVIIGVIFLCVRMKQSRKPRRNHT